MCGQLASMQRAGRQVSKQQGGRQASRRGGCASTTGGRKGNSSARAKTPQPDGRLVAEAQKLGAVSMACQEFRRVSCQSGRSRVALAALYAMVAQSGITRPSPAGRRGVSRVY